MSDVPCVNIHQSPPLKYNGKEHIYSQRYNTIILVHLLRSILKRHIQSTGDAVGVCTMVPTDFMKIAYMYEGLYKIEDGWNLINATKS